MMPESGTTGGRPLRVLLAKPGLDGHFRGVAVIASALKDAGMEVIYTGPRQTPGSIVSTAVDEDVDVVGLNVMTASASRVCQEVLRGLEDAGIRDRVLVVVGGIIKTSDQAWLKDQGIDGVFGPGTSTKEVIRFIMDQAVRDG